MVSTSKDKTKQQDLSNSPQPVPRPGATSPDVKRKNRISSALDNLTSANGDNTDSKDKKKKAFAKMDLFNLRSRNANASQVNVALASPSTVAPEKALPSSPTSSPSPSPVPPLPPSKETFWRGQGRKSVVCTEDEFQLPGFEPVDIPNTSHPHQQQSHLPQPPPSPSAQQLQTKTNSTLPQHSSPLSQHPLVPLDGVAASPEQERYTAGRGDSNLGSDLIPHGGHTDGHEHAGCDILGDINGPQEQPKLQGKKSKQPKQQQYARPTSPEPFIHNRPTSPTPPLLYDNTNTDNEYHQTTTLLPLPPQVPPKTIPQQSSGIASTMSEDLSRLSNNSLCESHSNSSISDHSLQMEEVFGEVYYEEPALEDPNRTPARDMAGTPLSDSQDLSQNSSLRPQQEHPLSALERIQQEQKRRWQEHDRLAGLVPPATAEKELVEDGAAGSKVAGPTLNNLAARNFSHDFLPLQSSPLSGASSLQSSASSSSSSSSSSSAKMPVLALSPPPHALGSGGSGLSGQAPRAASAAAVSGEVSESAMLDQLMAFVHGPNRPKLPSPLEWQKGLEELQRKRKDDLNAPMVSSVGRQNSSASRHSKESSDGRGRRHSMPDMPHGQSSDDRRGDNFKNPMLLSAAGNSPMASDQRRSVYGEAQRQSTEQKETAIPLPSKQLTAKNNRGGEGARTREKEKDVVDVAFDDMLTSLSLPTATRTQLESLPKERKWEMLLSNDGNPSLYQTPQTMPPQYFVDALAEYTSNKKRTLRDQYDFNPNASSSSKSLGMWKNYSAANISLFSLNETSGKGSGRGGRFGSGSSATFGAAPEPTIFLPQPQQTFQQQITSMLGVGGARNSEKKALEEREQVLKKLRVLIRNGSIRWTGEFIKVGGPSALLHFCNQIQKSEETKLGQRERLLHQVVQCIKAIVSLEGGVESLVKESIFFPLMRVLAIEEAPVLDPSSSQSFKLKDTIPGTKTKLGFFSNGSGSSGSSSSSGSGPGSRPGSSAAKTRAATQQQQRTRSASIPKPLQNRFTGPFQSSPALSVDQIPTFSNSQGAVGVLVSILAREPELRDKILKETVADPTSDDDDFEDDEDLWEYSEWIGYLKEVIKMCGVDIPSTPPFEGLKLDSGRQTPLTSDKKKRRHTAATPTPNLGGGIKYEPGEDREVLAYLTAHLELVSKLIFDMHLSGPGIAFAKAIRESQLEGYLQIVRSTFIQNQDLGAQIEDLIIQLSTIPSTTHFSASNLPHDLPVIPPFDAFYKQRNQRPLSPQYQHYPSGDAKYGAQIVPKSPTSEISSRGNSLELSSSDRYPTKSSTGNGSGIQKPVYGGGLARNPPQTRPNLAQRAFSEQQTSGTNAGAGKPRKGAAAAGTTTDDSRASPLPNISRQPSSKRTSMDGARRETDAGKYSQLPSPQKASHGEKGRMPPANGFYRDLQLHTSSLLTPMMGRRATVGEIVPLGSGFKGTGESLVSKLPVIPPKNRNRPTSMDAKVRGSDLLPGVSYTTVKLDQFQYHPSRPGMNIRLPSAPVTRPVERDMEDSRAAAVPRSTSTNTFGQGRRPSLNSTGNSDTVVPPLATPTLGMGRVHELGFSYNNLDGSSSYSSATSSGFSVTSSSSVSPPSTQTRKHSMLVASEVSSKQTASPNASVPFSASDKAMGGLRDVDFDNQIQEDVRKLASSSSTSTFGNKRSEDDTDSKLHKLEIQATDPRVLEAPIVVPDDLSAMRGQYIRDQLSGIVLPPMEPKKTRESTEITKASSRRVSVSNGNSGIPVPSHSNPGSKILFSDQQGPGSNAIPRPSPNTRRRSVDPSTPRPLSAVLGVSHDNSKTRIPERTKVFERA
ncbi:hypothetical protein BGX31_009432 [Mortierella sp. GBA43]|nr:hypothetical protein BGX31_009432 [Mortierella sp. GBA43]